MIILKVNNQRKIKMTQDIEDGNIIVDTLSSKNELEKTFNISAGDMVMLLNYYQHQKEQGKEMF